MKAVTALALCFCVNIVFAQDAVRKQIDPSTLVDEIFASQDLNINYQDLYENYLQIISNPFDLNTVTDEQLASLYLLNVGQIQSFMAHRKETGPFISVYELQSIPGFTKELCEKIMPFVTIGSERKKSISSLSKQLFEKGNGYLIMRWSQTLEQRKGYLPQTDSASRYAGSSLGQYIRFRSAKVNDYSIGFTLKKDPGEAFTWNPSKKYYGFDYLSFHVQIQNVGKLKNIIVGDFQSQFGQGIALGSAFGIGKNGEAVTTIRRSNLGFSPYTSQYEAGYFRGAAATYELRPNLFLHSMVSSRSRDASASRDSLQNTLDVVSSFNYTGLHRTPNELAGRSKVAEVNYAAVVNYKKLSLDAGILFHSTHFGAPLLRSSFPYNQFYFNGSSNTNIGGFCNYSFRNVAFFSEWTHTVGSGSASVVGLLASLSSKLDVSLVHRNFDKNFYSFFSNAIAENSIAQNENGFYWGWKYTFNKKCSVAGYFDAFQFPWLKYRSYSPSAGNEWLLRFNYKPTKSIDAFVQFREESKPRNLPDDGNLYLTGMGTRRNYWVNVDYSATMQLRFKTRVQFSTFEFNNTTTQGSVVLQDISLTKKRFSITGRYALFDTDTFDNRLYVYERDVWLAFAFPAYNGKGTRTYLLMQYEVNGSIDVWLRWSRTHYLSQESIGSGGETIIGNTENDVKLQVRLKL